MKRIISFVCALSLFVFIFTGAFSPAVYAAGLQNDRDQWAIWWAEQYCGFDASQISSTDYGSSLHDCVQKQLGDTADYISESVDNVLNSDSLSSTVNQQWRNSMNYAKNTIGNTVVTAENVGNYLASKAETVDRAVDNTLHKCWSAAGGDFWESCFNDLFNNNGYNQQFEQQPNGSYQGVTTDGKSWSINGVSYGSYSVYDISPQTVFSTPLYENCHENNSGWYGFLLDITANGEHCFYYNETDNGYNSAVSNVHISNVAYGANNAYLSIQIIYTQWGHDRYEYLYFNLAGDGNISEGGTSVALPYSVGFINYGGSFVPVYSDPSLNDFTINPNGTVSKDNGDGTTTDYPIYIDPQELSDDGKIVILNYIVNNYPGSGIEYNINGSPLPPITIKDTGNDFNFTLQGIGENIYDSVLRALKDFFGNQEEDEEDENTTPDNQKDFDFGDPYGELINLWSKVLQFFGLT